MGSINEDVFQDDSVSMKMFTLLSPSQITYGMGSVAAIAAATFSKTAATPLERVKILFQTRAEGFHSIGVCQSLRKMVQHEGLKGLYKGNGVSVLRMYPYSAFRYMTYELYRSWLLQSFPSVLKGPLLDVLAGSAAGGTAFLCTYPLDLARTKLAYQVVNLSRSSSNGCRCIHSYQPAYRGIIDVFRTINKQGGICAFYRGVGPTLGGILPYTGLKYLAYEELKRQLPDEHKDSISLNLACGSLASLFGQTLTYPLDVVRRQMQVDIRNQGGSRYKNTMQGLVAIARNQGWRQLYAGASINYIKVIPSVAVCFTSFYLVKHCLNMPSRQNV